MRNLTQAHTALVESSSSRSYVAAPICVGSATVGFFHGDRYYHRGDVTEFDRDLLSVFAEGFSFALERTLLMERLGRIGEQVRSFVLHLGATGLGSSAELDLMLPSPPVETAAQAPIHPADTPTDSRLTRREMEVLRLMANGDTNGRLARKLAITEGTAKSHVKHILRKLGAANRAEAVARWHQTRFPQQ